MKTILAAVRRPIRKLTSATSAGVMLVMLMLFFAAACRPPETPTTNPGLTPPSTTATPTPTSAPSLTPERPSPTPGQPNATPTPSAIVSPTPQGGDPSPLSLPTREVSFRVQVPADTPPEPPVQLLVGSFIEWSHTQRVTMEHEGGGVWTGSAELEEGVVTRYVYDRWDGEGCCEAILVTREGHGETVRIGARLLLVTGELGVVEDVVETWNDLRAPATTGTVSGLVTDAVTGLPVMDANVSVAGIHTATDWDGRFLVRGVAAGAQRVVVHRDRGNYAPVQAHVTVPAVGDSNVAIAMQPLTAVAVTFEALLPANTPPDVEVRLAGSLHQAGARLPPVLNMSISGADLHLPVMERVAPDRATLTLELYDGAHLQYAYTIGSTYVARERDLDGQEVFRSFVVDSSDPERVDRVAAWNAPWENRVILRMTTPPDTDPDLPVVMRFGPSMKLTQTGPHSWTAVHHALPGHEFRYRYVLGDDPLASDASPGTEDDGWRTLVFVNEPRSMVVVEETVTSWSNQRAVTPVSPGQMVDVVFRVAVPTGTEADATVRLLGDAPAIASGVTMTPLPGNPWAREATVRLEGPGPVTYWFDRGDAATASDRVFTADVYADGQVEHGWVASWGDEPAPEREFMGGAFFPDFWSPIFLSLSPQAMRHVKDHESGWVALSSVWSYETIQPMPMVGPRPVLAPTVLTPRDDLLTQARMAHEAGVRPILVAQFNMEMSPGGGEALSGTHSEEWWDAWLVEAERFWMWNALLAEEAGIEVLLLPGFFFHVFAPEWGYPSAGYIEEFDLRLVELMEQVREVYTGRILMSGSQTHLDAPAHADLVGMTTYDIGHPDVPPSASVEEWRAAYEIRMSQTLDLRYERYGRPIFVYTIHVPSRPTVGDPAGEMAQARQLTGLLQALESRPWVAGSLAWAYLMTDAPMAPGDGFRGRLAEAALARYYASR